MELATIYMRLSIFICLSVLLFSACHSFDSKTWKSDKLSRRKQANYLINHNILSGKSYQEVLQLLGEEDLNFQLHDTTTNNFTIEYILGTYWIDFDRLAIRLSNGSVDSIYRYHN